MNSFELKQFSRRRALGIGAGLASGLFASTLGLRSALADDQQNHNHDDDHDPQWGDIKEDIEEIIQAKGKISHGLVSISIDRNDITNVSLHGVPITPAFQINGSLYFQKLEDNRVIMNADMALRAPELDPFIHELIAHDIIFQAEHQHMYDFDPIVWFIHFRGTGEPHAIARGVKAALKATSTPFPQTPPSDPKSPLPAEEMGEILGAKPSIKSDGVVHFSVPRAESIRLGGINVNPYLNIAAPIAFQPHGGGQNAVAVPDFAMIASEINDVVGTMQRQGWDIGCLYNQETDEHPQLYFSHQFKMGNALQLAREIRNGLDRTHSKFIS